MLSLAIVVASAIAVIAALWCTHVNEREINAPQ